MSKILVVDDQRSVLGAFEEILASRGHDVTTATRAEQALERLRAEDFDLVVMDVCLPGMSGLEALRTIKEVHPKLPVIIMTGQGTMETAIEATKIGAFDYHLKPLEPAEMLQTIDRALEGSRLARQAVVLGTEAAPGQTDAMIGRSSAMQTVYKTIGRVAPTEATVLIRGESGTGKELVARAIYQHSRRSEAPLLVVNCAAIPETLLESELFGHEQGSFTGAVARRIGKFQQADKGTIFLDEIGDIPLGIQSKILRVLQEKTLERLGSNETISVNVRVLAATNRPLERAIAAGTFREDLYHRLNVVSIHLPPLRQRREDIPSLVDYFLRRFAVELDIEVPVISEDAQTMLADLPWPGNVRELAHTIQRALILNYGYPIQASSLRDILDHPGDDAAELRQREEKVLREVIQRHLASAGQANVYEHLLHTVERLLLAEALRKTKGNQSRAARLLGLARPTLHAKLQKHGFHASGELDPPD